MEVVHLKRKLNRLLICVLVSHILLGVYILMITAHNNRYGLVEKSPSNFLNSKEEQIKLDNFDTPSQEQKVPIVLFQFNWK
ncbi:hypothetical protein [Sphingobacterium sp. LRF_L2]|uniref:hypothetical protein n=1 Tax=Sphingobacterium sp. LRF_L2 TaxID=3369421 RepID=UPI003F61DCF3